MKTRLAIAGAVLATFLFTAPVFAQGTRSPFPTPRKSGLIETRLRSCQARENAVKNRMESLTRLVENMEKVFDSIATRVENFYTNTILPSGKTVPNYDSLVADISAKKDVVDADLKAAQDMVDAFNCTGDDPKGLLTDFRVKMQKVKSDLKSYRTSIKNLIVAVKPLAPEASPEASEKPERTEKPEGTEKPEESEAPESTPTPIASPAI